MSLLSFQEVWLQAPVRPRVRELNLELEPGQCVFLLGPNGAGKSSVLRLALGLEAASQGSVRLAGVPISQLTAAKRAARVAWLPQVLNHEQALTAREVVAIARYRFREARAQAENKAEEWLERVGGIGFAERRMTQLSGGEQQRVKLAALLAQETPLLLLDEPANHLDPAQQLEVYQLLAREWRGGRGVLCVTHDINLVSVLKEPERVRLLGLKQGKLCFDTHYADPGLRSKLESLFEVAFHEMATRTHEGEVARVWLPVPGTRREEHS